MNKSEPRIKTNGREFPERGAVTRSGFACNPVFGKARASDASAALRLTDPRSFSRPGARFIRIHSC